MTTRLDALCVREDNNGKSWFTKIGAAFPNKAGKGYTLMRDAVPASSDGQYKIMLREPLPKDGDGQNRKGGWSKENSFATDTLDDDIPF